MPTGLTMLAALTLEGIIARVLAGALLGLVAYYLAKRWKQDTAAAIALVACLIAGGVGGLWLALMAMTASIIYAHDLKRTADRAARTLRIFRVGQADFAVDTVRSVYSLDTKSNVPLLSVEAYGDSNQSVLHSPWSQGVSPSFVVRAAPTQHRDGFIEARIPVGTAHATFTCAGTHALEDVCIRLHTDGRLEVFGQVVLQSERVPLRIQWVPGAWTRGQNAGDQ